MGSLEYPQSTDTAAYTGMPEFLAFKFGANAGDSVDIRVKSADGGDAVAWVLDDTFATLTWNDDAAYWTLDSHVKWTAKAGETFTYYLVFRDYWERPATFTVSFAGTKAKCGGIVGRQCPDSTQKCVYDDPNCNPANGGADCTGTCKSCTPTNCGINGHWSDTSCSCVVCGSDQHWDDTQGKCVDNACVQTVMCTTTSHWDSTACACVANPSCIFDSDCSWTLYPNGCQPDPNAPCDFWSDWTCEGLCQK